MDFPIFKEKSQGSADFVRGQHLARNSKNPAVHTAFHRCIAQRELKQSWRERIETPPLYKRPVSQNPTAARRRSAQPDTARGLADRCG